MAGHSDSPSVGQGPQNPAVEPNSAMANRKGTAYEVYSINEQGQRKRHQVWEDRPKAYAQLAALKKLYGAELHAGIREIVNVKGNLFSQSVKKCLELLGKAAHMPPVTGKKVGSGGIVTGHGQVMTGKSPKVTGKVSTTVAIGKTKSGKTIHNEPGHAAHEGFSAADHMDAYRAHASHLSRIDDKTTHPSIVAHHKQALNTHFKLGASGIKKSYATVVESCRSLLK